MPHLILAKQADPAGIKAKSGNADGDSGFGTSGTYREVATIPHPAYVLGHEYRT